MNNAGIATKQTIANLLINRVKLYPNKAVVEGTVPLHPDALVLRTAVRPYDVMV